MAVMEKLEQMTVATNTMQAQLETLAAALTNQKNEEEIIMLELREQLHSQDKNLLIKKLGHQDESYYNKNNGRNFKGMQMMVRSNN